MTIKELIEFTGKSERTVRNWIKKANIVRYAETAQRIEIDYTIDEVEEILKAGSMSKDAVYILMQNARQAENKNPLPIIDSNGFNMKLFADMMAVSMATALKPLYDRLEKIEGNPTNQLTLPVVSDIEPRAYLNQLVREYAQLKNVAFRKAWNVLYDQILYRCHENIKVKANNEGIKPIDYLERENKILNACSIMKGLIDG